MKVLFKMCFRGFQFPTSIIYLIHSHFNHSLIAHVSGTYMFLLSIFFFNSCISNRLVAVRVLDRFYSKSNVKTNFTWLKFISSNVLFLITWYLCGVYIGKDETHWRKIPSKYKKRVLIQWWMCPVLSDKLLRTLKRK